MESKNKQNLKQKSINYIASFWVGNWFFKFTQTVLFLNIFISSLYSIGILLFLIFPRYELGEEALIVLALPVLYLAASADLALMFFLKSLNGKCKNLSDYLKLAIIVVYGCSNLIILIKDQFLLYSWAAFLHL